MNDEELKKLILDTAGDLALDFLIHDRDDDEELSTEQLQIAVEDGVVTLDEIMDRIRLILEAGLVD